MKDDSYLVTEEEIDAMQGLKKAHFLNSNAVRINKSLGDMTGLTGIGFHIIGVEPGHETTEFHCHYHEDECVYISAGRQRQGSVTRPTRSRSATSSATAKAGSRTP